MFNVIHPDETAICHAFVRHDERDSARVGG